MDKILKACDIPGNHKLIINCKYPLSYNIINRCIPTNIRFKIHKRNIWNDIKKIWLYHLIINLFFCFLPCLGYIAFWIYEKKYPLYIIDLYVPNNYTNNNPMFKIKVEN